MLQMHKICKAETAGRADCSWHGTPRKPEVLAESREAVDKCRVS